MNVVMVLIVALLCAIFALLVGLWRKFDGFKIEYWQTLNGMSQDIDAIESQVAIFQQSTSVLLAKIEADTHDIHEIGDFLIRKQKETDDFLRHLEAEEVASVELMNAFGDILRQFGEVMNEMIANLNQIADWFDQLEVDSAEVVEVDEPILMANESISDAGPKIVPIRTLEFSDEDGPLSPE